MAKQIYTLAGDQQRIDARPFVSSWRADGVNDYASRTNINGSSFWNYLNLNQAWSFSAWIKLISAPTSGIAGFYFYQLIAENSDFLIVDLSSIQIAYTKGTLLRGKYCNSLAVMPYFKLGKWHHVAGSWNGNDPALCKLYINSIDVDKIASATFTDSVPLMTTALKADLSLYDTNITDNYQNAQYNDIRFWTGVISPENVRKLYHNGQNADIDSSNLLFRLKMNQSSDFESNVPSGQCRILDSSGNNNHFSIYGQGTSPTLNYFY